MLSFGRGITTLRNNSKPKPRTARIKRQALPIIIVLAALLPYLSSLRGKFTLDDWALIVYDPLVHSLSNITKAFQTDFLHGNLGDTIGFYYRPLSTVSFQLDYALWGANPLAFRVMNVLMNLAVVLLVFGISKRIAKSNFVAGVAAVAFAVLPSHAESVSWICGRTDVLSTLFILASLLLFMTLYETRPQFNWPLAVCCSLLFGCALFSKEMGIATLILIAAYLWIFGKSERKKDLLKWVIVMLPTLIVYMVCRKHVVGSSLESIIALKIHERLVCIGIAYAAYLRMLFVPQESRVIYDVFPMAMKYPMIAAATWLLPIGLLGLTVWARKRTPIVAFGALWVFLALLPVSNILPTIGPLPAERFVYLASVGSSLIIGWMALKLYELRPKSMANWPTIAMIIICAFMIYCGLLTVQSCKNYESDIRWARGISASNTRFAIMRSEAGRIFFAAGYPQETDKEIEAAIARSIPGQLDSCDYIRLAVVKRTLGQVDASLKRLAEAKRLFGDKPEIEYQAGIGLAATGQMQKAAEAFQLATKLDPKLAPAWRNLGKASFELKDYKEAIRAYERAASLVRLSAKDRLNLALAYKKAAMPGKAQRLFQQIVKEDAQGEPGKRAAKEILSIRQ